MPTHANVTPVPADVAAAIHAAQRVALVGHVTPDADCLGSMGALARGLARLGKQSFPALPDGTVARKLNFLVEMGGMTPATAAQIAACDLAVVVDTAKDSRVNIDGKLDALQGVPICNIDHHATNPGYGKWNWVDAGRSSSAEMVFEVLRALPVGLDADAATLLYAGLHSDTQGFSLSNTTPRSLEVGHELAACGADVPGVCERLNRSRSRSEFELLQVVYKNTRVSSDGKLSWSTASHAEITGAGCKANDIDDQVEIVRSIEGILVAILFSEGNPGKIRMNFRAEKGISALALAQQFGGGGHTASAGAILDGTVEQVVERVLPAAQAYVSALGRS